MTGAESLVAIRTAICERIVAALEKAELDPVNIWPYEPFAAREGDLRAFYLDGDVMRGWHVRRPSSAETEDGTQFRTVVHRFRVVALRAIEEPGKDLPLPPPNATVSERLALAEQSSEWKFDAELEAGRDAFRAADTLWLDGVCVAESIVVGESAGLQLVNSAPAMFAGVLCHFAELELMVQTSMPIGEEVMDEFLRAGVDYAQPGLGGEAVIDMRKQA